MIYSITDRCNLDCRGCYAKLLHTSGRPELTHEQAAQLLEEARDLGVSVILLAGGEPLIRPQLLDLTARTPQVLFLLFTNGSLIDDATVSSLRRQKHVIPILSLEGFESLTDERRGQGTYRHVMAAMGRLQRARLLFGTSITLTSQTFESATDEQFLRGLIDKGCRIFFYINYVPVAPGTDSLQPTLEQVALLRKRLEGHRASLPALFVAFPDEEVKLGGCLAAGRGFVHINAYGDVEPCPFSPYSDSNVSAMSLEQALDSPLFRRILTSGVVLDESDGQCALWKRRDWVASLCDRSGKRSTDPS